MKTKESEKILGISVIYSEPTAKPDPTSYEYLLPDKVALVERFHKSLPFYRPTPLVSLEKLSEKLGVGGIYVKDESRRFEDFGLNAFKGLGGIFAVSRILCEKLGLDPNTTDYAALTAPEIREKCKDMVFLTTTDGNHGRGLAWAAHQFGCKSYVYMPKGSAPSRVEAIKRVGAEDCIVSDLNYDDTVRLTAKLAEEKGWCLVQDTAWNGYEKIPKQIVQGYSTIAKEAMGQLEAMGVAEPTHIFLQAGVGCFAGSMVGCFSTSLKKKPRFILVEPTATPCLYQSAKVGDGAPHVVENAKETIMAGLNCGEPCICTWPVIRDLADAYIACDDEVAEEGMRLYAYPVEGDEAIVSGESGAPSLGLVHRIMARPELESIRKTLGLDEKSRILLISTEGATDPEGYERIVGKKA